MTVPVRIRRSRTVSVVESSPVRVRRTRSVVVPPPSSVVRVTRRVRNSPVSAYEDLRPRFYIDWNKSLGYKLQIYLVTSYLYYNLCRSVITDHEFDRLCKELAEGWEDFEHQHKHCTDRESMVAATGYANQYPLMVRCAANSMLAHYREIGNY